MKKALSLALALLAACTFDQGHDVKPADAMKELRFMEGEWTGRQVFNTGGAPMSASVVAKVQPAIGKRYLEESLNATVEGRGTSDTRHFLTFDPTDQKYHAWWFNDSAIGAMELSGDFDGNKLVMTSKPTKMSGADGAVLRVTYEKLSEKEFGYGLELKRGEEWMQLFHTVYSRKG